MRHEDIEKTPAAPVSELRWALSAHYLIGAGLGGAYFALGTPAFWTGLAFGLATNLLPWFVLFPCFGYGVFGRAAPPTYRLLATSSWNHATFGLALGTLSAVLGWASLSLVPR